MKKLFIPLIASVLCLLISCKNNSKEKIVGIWKLEVMNINNTALRGSSLGNWLWEFNDEGGYLVNVAGAVEKGKYEVDKEKLKLKPITVERPEQVYTITKLDSVTLQLEATTDKNKTTLSFVKLEGEEVAEKD